MTAWMDADVFKLIDLWKEVGIQEQLEGSTRNKHIYDKLAADLTEAGNKKTGNMQKQDQEAASRVKEKKTIMV